MQRMVIAVVGDEVMTLPATGKLFIELFILPGISIYTAGEVEGGSTRFANFYISAPDFFKWKSGFGKRDKHYQNLFMLKMEKDIHEN